MTCFISLYISLYLLFISKVHQHIRVCNYYITNYYSLVSLPIPNFNSSGISIKFSDDYPIIVKVLPAQYTSTIISVTESQVIANRVDIFF